MALIERLHKTTQATFWPGKIPMNYIYTAGRAGEVFFKSLKDKGEFVGCRCVRCELVYLPPRIYCERCFQRIEGNYVVVQPRGRVHTFTVCHQTHNQRSKDKPSIVAAIRLEGADGLFMHWLGEVEPGDCTIGMRVEAVFRPKAQRQASILDIEHFRPL